MQILYLSKDNPVGHAGLAIVRRHFPQAAIQSHLFQSPRELLPNWVETQNNLLISFLCPRIIPKAALDCSALPINFHPAPPEYPGFGCYNFALYDAVTTYGVSCHRITPQIDSGEIFAVRRFGVLSEDTISTLQQRSLQELCGLLDDVMAHVSEGKTLVAT
ncbi:MAG: hypothetical protein FJ184_15415, partial [Gammaproteobacteria bacterium]|nr:hypothetical protein [Gammaproteobacteria bacterium]